MADKSEPIARLIAERFTGAYARRPDEPVDVCRWHRELADDIVDALLSDEAAHAAAAYFWDREPTRGEKADAEAHLQGAVNALTGEQSR